MTTFRSVLCGRLLNIVSLLVLLWAVTAYSNNVEADQAKELIDTWVASQNKQDFATYSALYSEKFSGVKKVGENTSRYGKKGWLDDRAKMFKKPFTVAIENLEIKKSSGGFEAGFYQKWNSKTYSDRGWKIIRMADENGRLKILEERLKYSNLVIATPKSFQEALAKVEEVPPDTFEEIMLTPKGDKIQFEFTRVLGEGGDERYSGTYKVDGKLWGVTQILDYSGHSMGEGNSHTQGELTRKYSALGKLEMIEGKVRSENIQSQKLEGQWVIRKVTDEGIENFNIQLPPLSVPPALLKTGTTGTDDK